MFEILNKMILFLIIIVNYGLAQEIIFPGLAVNTFRICQEPDGRYGYCTRESLCDEAKNRTNPKLCGYVNGEPVICCLYDVGVDPYECDVPDGRPGRCVSRNNCPKDLADYFGLSDKTFCVESDQMCCPQTGNSVSKSVEELCATGRGTYSDYYFPTCGDDQIWGKEQMKSIVNGNVNKEAEEIIGRNLTITNRTSTRGLIKTFVYVDENGKHQRKHYIDVIGSTNCLVLVHGIVAELSLTKYMALLGSIDEKTGDIDWFCDGVLINYDWVLTAAHCPNGRDVHIIRLGEHSHDTENDEVVPRDYEVKEIIFHPEYTPPAAYNDIALIKLNETVAYHPGITPICLPWNWKNDRNSKKFHTFTVAGWGATQFLGASSSVLREADLELADLKECERNYTQLPFFSIRWPNGMSENNTLCAADPTLTGRDACQGDSGGPLFYLYKNSFVLAGIVSLGYGCGNPTYPGIYVPIYQTHYLEWIKNVAFVDTCKSRKYYEKTMTCFYTSGEVPLDDL